MCIFGRRHFQCTWPLPVQVRVPSQEHRGSLPVPEHAAASRPRRRSLTETPERDAVAEGGRGAGAPDHPHDACGRRLSQVGLAAGHAVHAAGHARGEVDHDMAFLDRSDAARGAAFAVTGRTQKRTSLHAIHQDGRTISTESHRAAVDRHLPTLHGGDVTHAPGIATASDASHSNMAPASKYEPPPSTSTLLKEQAARDHSHAPARATLGSDAATHCESLLGHGRGEARAVGSDSARVSALSHSVHGDSHPKHGSHHHHKGHHHAEHGHHHRARESASESSGSSPHDRRRDCHHGGAGDSGSFDAGEEGHSS